MSAPLLMQGPTLFIFDTIAPMEEFTKPYLSIEQQIAKVSDRGLIIDNQDFVINCLKNIGYYRLSGYWYPMRQHETQKDEDGNDSFVKLDNFQEGVTFSNVIDIYNYDKELRMLLLDALEIIEAAIKTDVALQIGQYDPWSYRDPQYFKSIRLDDLRVKYCKV